MATYSLNLIPIGSMSFNKPYEWMPDGHTPWGSGHQSSGANWNGPDWKFTFSREDLVKIDIEDNDADPDVLNDDSWWNSGVGYGPGTQTIQTAIGGANVGDDITDEYELNFTAVVDGEVKTYTLAAIATGGSAFNYIGFTFDGEWPPEGVELTYVQNSNVDNASLDSQNMDPLCFAAGTLLATPHGKVAIEDLREGDLVLTRDHGARPIRWIGRTAVSAARLAAAPNLRPIRINAGALGENSPSADLIVSPQHRVLVRSRIAQRMFGTDEILVAAKQLLQLDGIDIAEDLAEVEYFHMLFDRHEIVISNGAETESLFTGPQALKSLGRAARDEIFALFPELRDTGAKAEAARPMASGRKGRKLALRHAQAGQALVN